MFTTRRLAALALAAGLVLAPACAKKYAAEKDGKDVGQAICDVKNADTKQEVADAIAKVEKHLDDVTQNYATFTAEDRADVRRQLEDLSKHQGNDLLLQQDLTVLRRSLENIRQDLGDAGKAALDGVFEGLDDCAGD
jgi:hypothetical protein